MHAAKGVANFAGAGAIVCLSFSFVAPTSASAVTGSFGGHFGFLCDGSYTNWDAARNSSSATIAISVGGGTVLDCGSNWSSMLLHANRCDSFTSIGGELGIRDPRQAGGPAWGSSGNMPKSEPCWRYSTRHWVGGGSGAGGRFELTHTYK